MSTPHNRSHTALPNTDPFPDPAIVENFDIDHLQEVTRELTKENEFLAEEIAIFNDYLQRNSQDSEGFGENSLIANDDVISISGIYVYI